MADRGRRGSRSGASAWDPGIFEPLPKRKRARKRIYEPAASIEYAPEPSGRKLSRAERERLRARHEERRTTPPPSRRIEAQKHRSSRWTIAAMIGLFAVLIGSIGAGRFLGNDHTPTPVVAAEEQPTQIAAVFLTPSPTPTGTPSPTPTETPTPAPTPTPDPRYIGKVVCLDPGHGGSDRGYAREENDVAPAMEEAFYNLAYARAVRFRLEQLGFTVVMTRDDDVDVNASGADVNGDGRTYAHLIRTDQQAAERAKDLDELQARINVCNEAQADLLVSMHINGFPDTAAKGYETWFSSARTFRDRNKRFAELAFEELGQEMEAAGYNARPRGVNDDADAHVEVAGDVFDRYVITGPAQPGQIVPSAMPGAIVEVLFISNDRDAAFLVSAEGRNAIVTAYEHAIVRYFDSIAEDKH